MSKKLIAWLAGRTVITILLIILITSPLLSQSLTLSIPDTSAAANSIVKMPIRITNVTGLGISSMDITLCFDQNVLDALGANSLGTISESWGNPLTTDDQGQINLIMTGITDLEGEGVLTYVFFDVTGKKDDMTLIHFKNISINEGRIDANTVRGKFTTREGVSAPDINLFMPDTSADAGFIIDLPIMASDLSRFNIDSLRITLTFNKFVLEALDVITTGTLTENWIDSIEARLPGKLSLFLKGTPALSDSGVLCKLQFQLIGSPGMSTAIHFQGLRFYNDTLKIGTIDGKIAISGGTCAEVIVSIPDISADSSSIIDVPIFISDVTNKDVWSASIDLEFKNNVLTYQSYNTQNTRLEGWLILINTTPGKIAIACASTSNQLSGQGVLIELVFKVIGKPGMQTAITFTKMELNEGIPSVTAYDGLFTVNYVIPVELVSFDARVVGRDILLTWETASESDNYGFEIERAKDLNQWVPIGFVPGYGTTTIAHLYSFIDKNTHAGTYYYRLKQIDIDGKFEYSMVVQIVVHPPKRYFLSQNYPNPFNPTTTITFELPKTTTVKLILYNVLGEVVELITDKKFQAGHHEIIFNAEKLATGLYFYKLEAIDFVDMKKLTVLK